MLHYKKSELAFAMEWEEMKQRTPWCKKRFTTSNDLEMHLRIYSPWLARTPAGATPARTPAGGMLIKIRCTYLRTFVGILARATYVGSWKRFWRYTQSLSAGHVLARLSASPDMPRSNGDWEKAVGKALCAVLRYDDEERPRPKSYDGFMKIDDVRKAFRFKKPVSPEFIQYVAENDFHNDRGPRFEVKIFNDEVWVRASERDGKPWSSCSGGQYYSKRSNEQQVPTGQTGQGAPYQTNPWAQLAEDGGPHHGQPPGLQGTFGQPDGAPNKVHPYLQLGPKGGKGGKAGASRHSVFLGKAGASSSLPCLSLAFPGHFQQQEVAWPAHFEQQEESSEAVNLLDKMESQVLYESLVEKLRNESLSINALNDIIENPEEMTELLRHLEYTPMERRKIHEILKAKRQRDAYVHNSTGGPA